jgi:hypothetical protein
MIDLHGRLDPPPFATGGSTCSSVADPSSTRSLDLRRRGGIKEPYLNVDKEIIREKSKSKMKVRRQDA